MPLLLEPLLEALLLTFGGFLPSEQLVLVWQREVLMGGLPPVADILHGMGKVQNAQRIWAMIVHPFLNPVRTVAHRTHRPGLLDPASIQFSQGLLLEALRLAHARKVGERSRLHSPFSRSLALGL